MSTIDISGLDPEVLVLALWRGTRALGLGVIHDRDDLTVEQVRGVIASQQSKPGGTIRLDYVFGRPIKVTLDGNLLYHSALYDRDAGEGECARIVAELRAPRDAS